MGSQDVSLDDLLGGWVGRDVANVIHAGAAGCPADFLAAEFVLKARRAASEGADKQRGEKFDSHKSRP
ncbi:hypothetical protein [Vibrio splendidus]|uniref:hypothetical protein n=1 Tax=Vibrio splendidus TaxID=29497 RepID=UPI0006601277